MSVGDIVGWIVIGGVVLFFVFLGLLALLAKLNDPKGGG